jgi:hypothetical protein
MPDLAAGLDPDATPEEAAFAGQFEAATFATQPPDERPDERWLRANVAVGAGAFAFAFAGRALTLWRRFPGLPLAQAFPLGGTTTRFLDANRGLVPFRPATDAGAIEVDLAPLLPRVKTDLPLGVGPPAVGVDPRVLSTKYFLPTLPGMTADLTTVRPTWSYRFASPALDQAFAETTEVPGVDPAGPVPRELDLTRVDRATAFAWTADVQLLPPDGTGAATRQSVGPIPGGLFALSLRGRSTRYLPASCTPADVRSALADVGATVTVTGPAGGPWVVAFPDAGVPPLAVTVADRVAVPVTAVGPDQRVEPPPAGLDFRLACGGGTTGRLPAAAAAAVQAALRELPGLAEVTVQGNAGGPWDIRHPLVPLPPVRATALPPPLPLSASGWLPRTPTNPTAAVTLRVSDATLDGDRLRLMLTFPDSGIVREFYRTRPAALPADAPRHVGELTAKLSATVQAGTGGAQALPRFAVALAADTAATRYRLVHNGQPLVAEHWPPTGVPRVVSLDGDGKVREEPIDGVARYYQFREPTGDFGPDCTTRATSWVVARRPATPTPHDTALTLDLVGITLGPWAAANAANDYCERWQLHDGDHGWPLLLGFPLYPIALLDTDVAADGAARATVTVVAMTAVPDRPPEMAAFRTPPPVDSTALIALTFRRAAGATAWTVAVGDVLDPFGGSQAPPPSRIDWRLTAGPRGTDQPVVTRVVGRIPAGTVDLTRPLRWEPELVVLNHPIGRIPLELERTTADSANALWAGRLTLAVPAYESPSSAGATFAARIGATELGATQRRIDDFTFAWKPDSANAGHTAVWSLVHASVPADGDGPTTTAWSLKIDLVAEALTLVDSRLQPPGVLAAGKFVFLTDTDGPPPPTGPAAYLVRHQADQGFVAAMFDADARTIRQLDGRLVARLVDRIADDRAMAVRAADEPVRAWDADTGPLAGVLPLPAGEGTQAVVLVAADGGVRRWLPDNRVEPLPWAVDGWRLADVARVRSAGVDRFVLFDTSGRVGVVRWRFEGGGIADATLTPLGTVAAEPSVGAVAVSNLATPATVIVGWIVEDQPAPAVRIWWFTATDDPATLPAIPVPHHAKLTALAVLHDESVVTAGPAGDEGTPTLVRWSPNSASVVRLPLPDATAVRVLAPVRAADGPRELIAFAAEVDGAGVVGLWDPAGDAPDEWMRLGDFDGPVADLIEAGTNGVVAVAADGTARQFTVSYDRTARQFKAGAARQVAGGAALAAAGTPAPGGRALLFGTGPRSRVSCELDVGLGREVRATLTGTLALCSAIRYADEAGDCLHRLRLYLDQVSVPVGVPFLGHAPAAAQQDAAEVASQYFAAVVEHTFRFADGRERTWQTPQLVGLITSRTFEERAGVTPTRTTVWLFDASATVWWQPATAAPTPTGPADVTDEFVALRLSSRDADKFDVEAATELRLPAACGLGLVDGGRYRAPPPFRAAAVGVPAGPPPYRLPTSGVQGPDVLTVERADDGRGAVLDFRQVTLGRYKGQTDNGRATVSDDGSTLHLAGNVWRSVRGPIAVTRDAVLEFEFVARSVGEFHAVAVLDAQSDPLPDDRVFSVAGDQPVGQRIERIAVTDDGFDCYRVALGERFTGVPQYLTFINDHDVASPTAESSFRNVRIRAAEAEASPVRFFRRTPAAAVLASGTLLAALRRPVGLPAAPSLPVFADGSSYTYLPRELPDLAGLRAAGDAPLCAATIVRTHAFGQFPRPLPYSTLVQFPYQVQAVEPAAPQDDDRRPEVQLLAFAGGRTTALAYERLPVGLSVKAWARSLVQSNRIAEGALALIDLREWEVVAAPPALAVLTPDPGHDWAVATGVGDVTSADRLDPRCYRPYPGGGLGPDRLRPDAAMDLLLFDAVPDLPPSGQPVLAATRSRLAPTWAGYVWRFAAADFAIAAGRALSGRVADAAADDADPTAAKLWRFLRDDDAGTLLAACRRIGDGDGSAGDAAWVAGGLNVALQHPALSDVSVWGNRIADVVSAGEHFWVNLDPTVLEFNERCRLHRRLLEVVFAVGPNDLPTPTPSWEAGARPARAAVIAANGDGQVGRLFGLTRWQETPFAVARRPEWCSRRSHRRQCCTGRGRPARYCAAVTRSERWPRRCSR